MRKIALLFAFAFVGPAAAQQEGGDAVRTHVPDGKGGRRKHAVEPTSEAGTPKTSGTAPVTTTYVPPTLGSFGNPTLETPTGTTNSDGSGGIGLLLADAEEAKALTGQLSPAVREYTYFKVAEKAKLKRDRYWLSLGKKPGSKYRNDIGGPLPYLDGTNEKRVDIESVEVLGGDVLAVKSSEGLIFFDLIPGEYPPKKLGEATRGDFWLSWTGESGAAPKGAAAALERAIEASGRKEPSVVAAMSGLFTTGKFDAAVFGREISFGPVKSWSVTSDLRPNVGWIGAVVNDDGLSSDKPTYQLAPKPYILQKARTTVTP